MLLVSLISYIDRNTLALLAPTILRETHLSAEQYGFIISSFSIAYMAANPIWGRVLDRVGLSVGMTIAVLMWSLASVSHAFAAGFWGFAAARLALGLGEGATFPGGLRTVMQTLPPMQRGRGIAIAYSGGSLGAVITPLVITPVFLWWGWRAAFWFTGLIGLAWLAVWFFVARRPDIRLVRRRDASTHGPRWGDPHLWAFISAYALGALPLGFVLYQAALYLNQALGHSQSLIGKLLWIPPLGWEIGYFVWGWISDRAFRSGLSRDAALRRMMASTLALSLPFALVPYARELWLVMLGLFLAMFAAAGFVILAVAYATNVYSTEHSGLVAGIGAGSWGAAVALAMPFFGHFFDQQRYSTAFLVATVFPVVGFVGWWVVNRRDRVVS